MRPRVAGSRGRRFPHRPPPIDRLAPTGRPLAGAVPGAASLAAVADAVAALRPRAICTLRVVEPSGTLILATSAGPAMMRAAAMLDADLPPLVLRTRRALLVRDARLHPRVGCRALWTERRYAVWYGVPLPGPDAPSGVLGLALPVGERPPRRAERALLEAHAIQAALLLRADRLAETVVRQAQALEVARSELLEAAKLVALGPVVSDVVHEASNVLGTVMLRMEALLDEPRDAGTSANLRALDAHCRQIADLLHELRRFWSGGGVRAVVSLDVLVDRLLRLREPRMRARGVRIERALAGELPAVMGDPAQLERVVLALLLDAESAMPGGGVVRLSTSARRDASGSWATLVVEDEGPAIPDEVLPSLFDPFGPRNTDRGPSMGLAAAHAAVTASGGRLTAANRAGGGVAVLLELPARH